MDTIEKTGNELVKCIDLGFYVLDCLQHPQWFEPDLSDEFALDRQITDCLLNAIGFAISATHLDRSLGSIYPDSWDGGVTLSYPFPMAPYDAPIRFKQWSTFSVIELIMKLGVSIFEPVFICLLTGQCFEKDNSPLFPLSEAPQTDYFASRETSLSYGHILLRFLGGSKNFDINEDFYWVINQPEFNDLASKPETHSVFRSLAAWSKQSVQTGDALFLATSLSLERQIVQDKFGVTSPPLSDSVSGKLHDISISGVSVRRTGINDVVELTASQLKLFKCLLEAGISGLPRDDVFHAVYSDACVTPQALNQVCHGLRIKLRQLRLNVISISGQNWRLSPGD